MKTLIAVVNWLTAIILAIGGIVFLSAALRKEFWKTNEESITYGVIGAALSVFAFFLAVSLLLM